MIFHAPDPVKRTLAPASARSAPATAGLLSLVTMATMALVILCLTACGDATAPVCRTSTRADSIALVAGVDTTWVPVMITVEVCR